MTNQKHVYIHTSDLFPNTVYIGEGSYSRAHSSANRTDAWMTKMKLAGYSIQLTPLMDADDAEKLESELIKSYRAAGWEVLNGNDGGRGPVAGRDRSKPNVFPKFDRTFNGLTVNIINRGSSLMTSAGMNGFSKSFSWPTRGDVSEDRAEVFTGIVREIQAFARENKLTRKEVDAHFEIAKRSFA